MCLYYQRRSIGVVKINETKLANLFAFSVVNCQFNIAPYVSYNIRGSDLNWPWPIRCPLNSSLRGISFAAPVRNSAATSELCNVIAPSVITAGVEVFNTSEHLQTTCRASSNISVAFDF